jgi:hypothetical protein
LREERLHRFGHQGLQESAHDGIAGEVVRETLVAAFSQKARRRIDIISKRIITAQKGSSDCGIDSRVQKNIGLVLDNIISQFSEAVNYGPRPRPIVERCAPVDSE